MARITESERLSVYRHNVKLLIKEFHDSRFEEELDEAIKAAREIEHYNIEATKLRSEGRVAHARGDFQTLSELRKKMSGLNSAIRSAHRRYKYSKKRLKHLKKRFLDPHLKVVCRMNI